MAENVVSIFLQRLDALMSHGGRFFVGVERQVQSIRVDLSVLSAFLQDADRKRRQDKQVDEWVREVQSFVYEAANIIDEFVLNVEGGQQVIRNGIKWLPKILSDSLPFRNAMRLVEEEARRIYLYSFRRKIKIHRTRLPKILNDLRLRDIRRVQHNGENRMAFPLSSAANMALFVEQAQVVGLEQDEHMLLPKLIGGEPRLSVISIVGMGGSGKTTLASILFRSSAVADHFDCRVWVTITQQYTPEQLLLRIMQSLTTLTTSEREMDREELRYKIFQHLRMRRYLVVIDDIWSVEPWDGLRGAFPDDMNGSRMMLTTRIKAVALRVDIFGSIHEQRLLSEHESWVLFCNIAFWNAGGDGCPPNLEYIGREMVLRCHGLPLAIKALGGRLSVKERHPAVWREVLEGLRQHVSSANWGIQSILDLSYDDLPYNFKSCFLYCGIFPYDYEIASSKLIRMWIAEGFIQGRGEHVMEDVASEILDELISRMMIQPMKMGHGGRVKTFRIHDLLRDLSVSIAKENNFVEHIDSSPTMDRGGRARTFQRLTDLFFSIAREFYSSKTNESIDSGPTMARRLALNFQCIGEYISSNQSASDCRSLLCFSLQIEMLQKVQAEKLFQRFKFLRVMDLTNVRIPWIPDGIGSLIHLRYLGLNGACLKKLPSSLSSLYNLQTLEIRGAPFWSCLSVRDVGNMIHLRHVLVDDGCLKFTGHKRVTHLLSLQSLSMVSAGSWIEDDLGKLTSIRKLGIRGCFSSHQKAFSESLGKLLCLRSLKLEEESEGPIPMSILFPNLPYLCKLHFVGWLEELHDLSNLCPNITKIILNNSRLGHSTFQEMEKLSNLRFLTLDSSSYVEKKLTCSAGGFPRLEVFNLRGLDLLEEWIVKEGAMASLKHLHISSCRQLKMLPEGLKHLIALERLEVFQMPDEFYGIRDNEAADWYNIRHIPMVATGEE